MNELKNSCPFKRILNGIFKNYKLEESNVTGRCARQHSVYCLLKLNAVLQARKPQYSCSYYSTALVSKKMLFYQLIVCIPFARKRMEIRQYLMKHKPMLCYLHCGEVVTFLLVLSLLLYLRLALLFSYTHLMSRVDFLLLLLLLSWQAIQYEVIWVHVDDSIVLTIFCYSATKQF